MSFETASSSLTQMQLGPLVEYAKQVFSLGHFFGPEAKNLLQQFGQVLGKMTGDMRDTTYNGNHQLLERLYDTNPASAK